MSKTSGEAVRVVPRDAVAVLRRPHGLEQRNGRRCAHVVLGRIAEPGGRRRARSPRTRSVASVDVERIEHPADGRPQIARTFALGGAARSAPTSARCRDWCCSRPPCAWRRSRRARARRPARQAARSSPSSPRRKSRNRRRSCRARRRNRARCRPSAPAARRGRRADRPRRSRPAEGPSRDPAAPSRVAAAAAEALRQKLGDRRSFDTVCRPDQAGMEFTSST